MLTKLELIRRQLGISQTELCRKIGFNPTSLVQVERGYRKPWPRFRTLIANGLEVAEAELFDDSGWPIRFEYDETVPCSSRKDP